MNSLERTKRKRFDFLNRIYEQSRGGEHELYTLSEVADDLQPDHDEAIRIVEYLSGEGLLKVRWLMGGVGSPVSITHLGVIQVEAALSEPDKPTQYFPAVNFIHVEQMIGSQIQQGTQASSQTGTFPTADTHGLVEAIRQFRDELSRLKLSDDDRAEAEAEMGTMEAQAKSPRPKWKVISGSWAALLRIAESAGGPILIEIAKRHLGLPSP